MASQCPGGRQMHERRVLVRGDPARATLALLVPFSCVIFCHFALQSKGYSFADVGVLLEAGELTWSRQLIGLAGLTYWVVLYTGPAMETISSGGALAWLEGDRLVTFDGSNAPLADVKEVRLERKLFSSNICFDLGGVTFRVPAIFTKRDVERISADLEAATAVDSRG